MVTEELLAYIKRQRTNGVPEESVREILLANGWLKQDVDKAFQTIASQAVAQSPVIKSSSLRDKLDAMQAMPASSEPVTVAPSINTEPAIIGAGAEFAPVEQSVASGTDSYREPIGTEKQPDISPANLAKPYTGGLPDDLKERLRKISSGSMFSPSRSQSEPIIKSEPLLNAIPPLTKSDASSIQSGSEPQPAWQSAISNPQVTNDVPHNLPTAPDPQFQTGELSSFATRPSGGVTTTPYTPSVDMFRMRPEEEPVRKSKAGIIIFLFLVLLAGVGYYVYSTRPAFVRSIIEMIARNDSTQIQEEEEPLVPIESQPREEPIVQAPVEQPVPSIPNPETMLTNAVSKVPGYVTAKGSMKGVCTNITAGIARDVIEIRKMYGEATCFDSINAFAIAAPYDGQYQCIDTKNELVLVSALPKTAMCPTQ